MLLSQEDQNKLDDTIKNVAAAYGIYMIGRTLGRADAGRAAQVADAVQIATLAGLDATQQAYIAGKIAGIVGPSELIKMGYPELEAWVKSHTLLLTQQDMAALKGRQAETERWIEGNVDKWAAASNRVLSDYDKEWLDKVATAPEGTELGELDDDRKALLADMLEDLNAATDEFSQNLTRLFVTELQSYFQMGQIADLSGDTWVWKIPALDACENCLEIYLNPDGSPRKYRLSEILGNSNIGSRPEAWGFVFGATHPHCIEEGTWIRVFDGIKRVEDIKRGDSVLTRKGFKKVLAAWCSGNKEIITLRPRNNVDLGLTEEHLVAEYGQDLRSRVKELGWKESGKLKSSRSRNDVEREVEWSIKGGLVMAPLVVEQFHESVLQLPVGLRLKKCFKPVRFPSLLTQELGYLFGYFTGDGTLSRQVVDFIIADGEEELVPLITDAMAQHFGIEAPDDIREQVGVKRYLYRSLELATWFRRLNLKRHVPDFIMLAAPEVKRAYLRGVFDADGTVVRGAPSLWSNQKVRLDETALLLLTQGIPSTVNVITRVCDDGISRSVCKGGCVSHAFDGYIRSPQFNLSIVPEVGTVRFSELVNFSLSAKRDKLGNGRGIRVKTKHKLTEDAWYLRLKPTLRQLSNRRVWDIAVEDVPEFVANGIVVHNCRCILFTSDDEQADASPDEALARAYADAVSKSLLSEPIELKAIFAPLRKSDTSDSLKFFLFKAHEIYG